MVRLAGVDRVEVRVERVEVDGGHVVHQRDAGELTRVQAECGDLHLWRGDGGYVGNTETLSC